MDSIALLKILIDKLEIYELNAADKNELSLEGFQASIQPSLSLEHLKNAFIAPENKQNITSNIENNIERVISQHLLFLYRYIKFYSKTAFSNTAIKSIEEFGFMATCIQHPAISKTELIKKNVIEKSSGIEIINRLIKSGHFLQSDNPSDLRGQLISLTPLGKAAIFEVFEKMNVLGHIATGELTLVEKQHLAFILKKLDTFHYENYYRGNIQQLEDYLPESLKNTGEK